MRRFSLLVTVAVLSLGFAPAPKRTEEAELKRLRGEWTLVSESRGGKPQTPWALS
jgi:hypothetical protein